MEEFDVLVIGGGAAGLVTAGALAQRGYSCLVIESDGIGAGQSGHSHGYLHQGYIYRRAQRALIQELKQSSHAWHRLLSSTIAETDSSVIGFKDPAAAEASSRAWHEAGLPVSPCVPPPWLSPAHVTVAFSTAEPSYSFVSTLGRLRDDARAHGALFCRGHVQRLTRRANSCLGAIAEVDGHTRRIRARFIVLAAGTGNAAILRNTLGPYRVQPSLRTSFMLVLRSPELPRASLILPEDRYYGLFMVSRTVDDGNVWLASNYVSFGGQIDVTSPVARYWTRAMERILVQLVPSLSDLELRVGVYAAPKAEARSDPEQMPDAVMAHSYGLSNCVVLWPTKLTLIAAGVADTVDRVAKYLRTPTSSSRDAPGWLLGLTPSLFPERWEMVGLAKRSLFDGRRQSTKLGL